MRQCTQKYLFLCANIHIYIQTHIHIHTPYGHVTSSTYRNILFLTAILLFCCARGGNDELAPYN